MSADNPIHPVALLVIEKLRTDLQNPRHVKYEFFRRKLAVICATIVNHPELNAIKDELRRSPIVSDDSKNLTNPRRWFDDTRNWVQVCDQFWTMTDPGQLSQKTAADTFTPAELYAASVNGMKDSIVWSNLSAIVLAIDKLADSDSYRQQTVLLQAILLPLALSPLIALRSVKLAGAKCTIGAMLQVMVENSREPFDPFKYQMEMEIWSILLNISCYGCMRKCDVRIAIEASKHFYGRPPPTQASITWISTTDSDAVMQHDGALPAGSEPNSVAHELETSIVPPSTPPSQDEVNHDDSMIVDVIDTSGHTLDLPPSVEHLETALGDEENQIMLYSDLCGDSDQHQCPLPPHLRSSPQPHPHDQSGYFGEFDVGTGDQGNSSESKGQSAAGAKEHGSQESLELGTDTQSRVEDGEPEQQDSHDPIPPGDEDVRRPQRKAAAAASSKWRQLEDTEVFEDDLPSPKIKGKAGVRKTTIEDSDSDEDIPLSEQEISKIRREMDEYIRGLSQRSAPETRPLKAEKPPVKTESKVLRCHRWEASRGFITEDKPFDFRFHEAEMSLDMEFLNYVIDSEKNNRHAADSFILFSPFTSPREVKEAVEKQQIPVIILPDPDLKPTATWRADDNGFVDSTLVCEVQDLRTRHGINCSHRVLPISEVIAAGNANPQREIFNILSIPKGPQAREPEWLKLVDIMKEVWDAVALMPMPYLEFPAAWRSWQLLATAGSFTFPHVDENGLCTWVRIRNGKKMWIFPRAKNGRWPTRDLKIFDPANFHLFYWFYIILEAGAQLIMKPGTPHAVFGLTNAMTDGGHFFSYHHMLETFRSRHLTRVSQGEITNSDHSSSIELVLRRMAIKAIDYALKRRVLAFHVDNFLALIHLVEHLEDSRARGPRFDSGQRHVARLDHLGFERFAQHLKPFSRNWGPRVALLEEWIHDCRELEKQRSRQRA